MATSPQNKGLEEESPIPLLSTEEAIEMTAADLCQQYIGKNPKYDEAIKAFSVKLALMKLERKGMVAPAVLPETAVFPLPKGAPRVPLYLESPPGHGKTTSIKTAAKWFAEEVGLTFVEDPEINHKLSDDEFIFWTVNMSGKNSPADFGNMPARVTVNNGFGVDLADQTLSAMKAVQEFTETSGSPFKIESKSLTEGTLAVTEFELSGGTPETLKKLAEVAIAKITEESRKANVVPHQMRTADAVPNPDGISYKLSRGTNGGLVVSVYQPLTENAELSTTLPNHRFHMASKTSFGLMNFDDVANASESLRNVLLEVAQSGRYSGVANVGSCLVTFTGNMGKLDGTHTSQQSDAELTRLKKYRVQTSPEELAAYFDKKYPGTNAHLASFIQRQGHEFLKEEMGAARGKKGSPKTNPRSIENALNEITKLERMADAFGNNLTMFREEVRTTATSTCGKTFADAYVAHMVDMYQNAIPLSNELFDSVKVDYSKLPITFNGVNPKEGLPEGLPKMNEKILKQSSGGDYRSQAAMDFGYRLSYALADRAAQDVRTFFGKLRADSNLTPAQAESKQTAMLAHVIKTLAIGCESVQPQMANATMSRFVTLLREHPEVTEGSRLKSWVNDSVSYGLAEAVSSGGMGNINNKEDMAGAMATSTEYTALMLGVNSAAPAKKDKSAAPTTA